MELLPADQLLFNRMMDTIRSTYEQSGFIPVDTPVLEKSEVLLAKGGGETEKQIYRFSKGDTDISMRFDLTVPLARYVAQNMGQLTFPFKRYQIGKVYRGERSQKGRFREFYQCDIDIIGDGKLALINDAEIPSIIYNTFKKLGFDSFSIRMNNRKILNGFFGELQIEAKADVLRIIDKVDKIGIPAVTEELMTLLGDADVVERVKAFMSITGSQDEIIEQLKALNLANEDFLTGLQELETVVKYIRLFGVPDANFALDLKIARGLDYYTGTVYETILNDYPSIGSVCSGGRYDNLAEYYTEKKLPGVGISIGLTRLFYQLREAEIIKATASTNTKLLIVPMAGSDEYAIGLARKFKDNGIITEIYLEEGKMAKKLTYANKLGIPYAMIIGEDEAATGVLTLKNMITGEQSKLSAEEVITMI